MAEGSSWGQDKTSAGGTVSLDDLKALLRDYSNRYADRVETTATDIATQTDDNRIRWRSVYWKTSAIPSCWDVTANPDPRAALVDTWILAVQNQFFAGSEDGAAFFGPMIPRVIQVAEANVSDIEQLASRVLTKDGFASVQGKVIEYAKANPLGRAGAQSAGFSGLSRPSEDNLLKKTFDTVFVPFRSIGKLDETALAIRAVARSAEEINLTAQRIPLLSRWNMELVLYQTEGMATVTEVRSNLTSFVQTAGSLSRTAENLPARLREELMTAMSQLDARQAGLQATLVEAQKTLAAGDKTLAQIQTASGSLAEAGTAWEGMIKALDGFVSGLESTNTTAASQTPPAESKPFDINDYAHAAERIATAATELRATIVQLEQLVGGDQARALMDQTTARTKDLVTHITLCLLALVLAIFVATVLAARLRRAPLKKESK